MQPTLTPISTFSLGRRRVAAAASDALVLGIPTVVIAPIIAELLARMLIAHGQIATLDSGAGLVAHGALLFGLMGLSWLTMRVPLALTPWQSLGLLSSSLTVLGPDGKRASLGRFLARDVLRATMSLLPGRWLFLSADVVHFMSSGISLVDRVTGTTVVRRIDVTAPVGAQGRLTTVAKDPGAPAAPWQGIAAACVDVQLLWAACRVATVGAVLLGGTGVPAEVALFGSFTVILLGAIVAVRLSVARFGCTPGMALAGLRVRPAEGAQTQGPLAMLGAVLGIGRAAPSVHNAAAMQRLAPLAA